MKQENPNQPTNQKNSEIFLMILCYIRRPELSIIVIRATSTSNWWEQSPLAKSRRSQGNPIEWGGL